jgi:hypothetical protein
VIKNVALVVLLASVAFLAGRSFPLPVSRAASPNIVGYRHLVAYGYIAPGKCKAGPGGFCVIKKVKTGRRPLSVNLAAGNGGTWEYSAAGSGIDVYHSLFAIANLKMYTLWTGGWLYVERLATKMTVPVRLVIDATVPM